MQAKNMSSVNVQDESMPACKRTYRKSLVNEEILPKKTVDFSKMTKRSSFYNLNKRPNYSYDVEPGKNFFKNTKAPTLKEYRHKGVPVVRQRVLSFINDYYNNDLDKQYAINRAPSFSRSLGRSDARCNNQPLQLISRRDSLTDNDDDDEGDIIRARLRRDIELKDILTHNMQLIGDC